MDYMEPDRRPEERSRCCKAFSAIADANLLVTILVVTVIYWTASDSWPSNFISAPWFNDPSEILNDNYFATKSVLGIITFILVLFFDVSGCTFVIVNTLAAERAEHAGIPINSSASKIPPEEQCDSCHGTGKKVVETSLDDEPAPCRCLPCYDAISVTLMACGIGTIIAGLTGSTPVIVAIESLSGVYAGGRTGLTSLTIALLCFASMFIGPLLGSIPNVATAPVLVFVGILMCREIPKINWKDITQAVPAFLCIMLMPFTSSISNGIFAGIIVYIVLKSLSPVKVDGSTGNWCPGCIAGLFNIWPGQKGAVADANKGECTALKSGARSGKYSESNGMQDV